MCLHPYLATLNQIIYIVDTVVVNIIERNTCVVILHYVTNCTVNAEEQQITVNLLMVRSVTEALIPALLIFFIGPWSDTNGRRPLILLSLTGRLQTLVINSVVNYVCSCQSIQKGNVCFVCKYPYYYNRFPPPLLGCKGLVCNRLYDSWL